MLSEFPSDMDDAAVADAAFVQVRRLVVLQIPAATLGFALALPLERAELDAPVETVVRAVAAASGLLGALTVFFVLGLRRRDWIAATMRSIADGKRPTRHHAALPIVVAVLSFAVAYGLLSLRAE